MHDGGDSCANREADPDVGAPLNREEHESVSGDFDSPASLDVHGILVGTELLEETIQAEQSEERENDSDGHDYGIGRVDAEAWLDPHIQEDRKQKTGSAYDRDEKSEATKE